MVALACERPADREVPLRRYSLSELTVEVANRLPKRRRRALAARPSGACWRTTPCVPGGIDPGSLRVIHTFWSGPVRCSTCTPASGRADHSGRTSTCSVPMRRPASRSDAGCIRPCPSDRTRPCASNTSTSVPGSCSTWQPGMSIAPWSLAAANRRPARPLSADWSTT